MIRLVLYLITMESMGLQRNQKDVHYRNTFNCTTTPYIKQDQVILTFKVETIY